jgi:type I restriction enzyme S subunit
MLVITGATVGRVNVYRRGLEPGFVSQHVSICRLPQSEIDPEFALWGLRGPAGQAQLLGQRYGQGKPGLNLANIRSLSLPFPPLPEQRRIVAELDALQAEVDALKRLQAETAAELGALLPAILDKAFKGEL